jgi:pimeloyl-ACP methyl ester carboxylesterase
MEDPKIGAAAAPVHRRKRCPAHRSPRTIRCTSADSETPARLPTLAIAQWPLIEPSLVDKVVAAHRALSDAQVGHAFGGALALAYYTNEPRATADTHLNIELESVSAIKLLDALPPDLSWNSENVEAISVDDQVRVWWGRTPIDLFFRASAFHEEVAKRSVWHNFLTFPTVSVGSRPHDFQVAFRPAQRLARHRANGQCSMC